MTALEPVSVIVCTWNRAALLRQTLQSLQSQDGIDRADVEVIVVDNNSSDDTKAVVEDLAGRWALGALRYEFEPEQGKQFALNRGIRAARHAVLAFTDDDILFPPDWLKGLQRLFTDPGIELAGGKTLIAWPASGRPAWYDDAMLAILAGVDLGDRRLDPAPQDYAPGGSNLIARRRLFDRVGAFSETHFRHMDFEFGMRCNRAGVRVVYEPSLVVYAPVDEKCLTRRYFRRWSFKAGIARDGGVDATRRRSPSVPRWIYRQIGEDALYAALRARWQPPATAFARELRLWRGLGTVANAWHAWWRPQRHAQWVQWHSQKKNNLY